MLITQARPQLKVAQTCFHLCLALQKAPVLPTIIIDEANQLQQWKEAEENQLAALLRFFVLITKEAKLAHVVLATSESSLSTGSVKVRSLCNRIHGKVYQVVLHS